MRWCGNVVMGIVRCDGVANQFKRDTQFILRHNLDGRLRNPTKTSNEMLVYETKTQSKVLRI